MPKFSIRMIVAIKEYRYNRIIDEYGLTLKAQRILETIVILKENPYT